MPDSLERAVSPLSCEYTMLRPQEKEFTENEPISIILSFSNGIDHINLTGRASLFQRARNCSKGSEFVLRVKPRHGWFANPGSDDDR
jgi:hypothetical protein